MCLYLLVLCFKQKTAYELRISDWSSDVCSSDLHHRQAIEREHQLVRRRIELAQACGLGRAGFFGLDRARGHADIGNPGDQVMGNERKSGVEGKSVAVRVDLGCRRCIKKTNNSNTLIHTTYNYTITKYKTN